MRKGRAGEGAQAPYDAPGPRRCCCVREAAALRATGAGWAVEGCQGTGKAQGADRCLEGGRRSTARSSRGRLRRRSAGGRGRAVRGLAPDCTGPQPGKGKEAPAGSRRRPQGKGAMVVEGRGPDFHRPMTKASGGNRVRCGRRAIAEGRRWDATTGAAADVPRGVRGACAAWAQAATAVAVDADKGDIWR